jgi:Zn-dependent protease with chaperone function
MVRKTPGGTRRAVWLAAILASVAPAASAQEDSVLEPALQYFTRHNAGEILKLFESARPAPVSDAERRRILAKLPRQGNVRELDTAQQEKLADVRSVLQAHRREGVYIIRVIQVAQAAVALHARGVVLISERALDLLDADELQAVVAHEVGHEYFWGDYFLARRDNRQSFLRRLELLCDGIAVITLERLGVNPERLISALDKISRYNRDRFGVAVNETNYPALGERRRFVERLVEWLRRDAAR